MRPTYLGLADQRDGDGQFAFHSTAQMFRFGAEHRFQFELGRVIVDFGLQIGIVQILQLKHTQSTPNGIIHLYSAISVRGRTKKKKKTDDAIAVNDIIPLSRLYTNHSKKVQMFENREIRYEQIVLGTQPQRVPYGFHVGFDVVALYERRSGRGTYQPGQHGHRGRLSGAVVAQQNGDLIRVHVHGQLVDDVLAGLEALTERLDLYAGLVGHLVRVDFVLEPERRL